MKFKPSTPHDHAQAWSCGLAATLLLGSGALHAQAPAAALEGCRALAADSARLACYDALLPPRALNPSHASAATGTPGNSVAAQPTTVPRVRTAPLASPATPPATGNALAAPTPPAHTATLERQFGLEDRRAQEERAQKIRSRIAGRFEGWGPREKLTLANGQVWQIHDDSVAAYNLDAPAVEIERGALGSFFMRVEGVAQTPKVRRLE